MQTQSNLFADESSTALASLLLALHPEVAFASTSPVGGFTKPASRGTSQMLDASQAASRRSLLAGSLALGLGATVQPALALNSMQGPLGFTKLGVEEVDPKDAERDDEILKSKAVQASLAKVKEYKEKFQDLKKALSDDKDMKVMSKLSLGGELSQGNLKKDLTAISEAFDEDTQATIDKYQRRILNNVLYLGEASLFKKSNTEKKRSQRKVDKMDSLFDAIDADFNVILAYFK